MLCGWEGNCRSGVTLAMRHRFTGLSTFGLSGQRKKGEHPGSAVNVAWLPLAIFDRITVATRDSNYLYNVHISA